MRLQLAIVVENSCKSGKAVMPIPREGFNTPVESIGTWASLADDDVLRSLPKQKVKSLAEMTRPVSQEMSNKNVTNGSSPGISASFLNAIEFMFAPTSGSTFVGKYWLQFGGNASGWDMSYFQTLATQNGSTPVSVSIDTTDQAPAASAGTPATSTLTAHGFLIMSVLSAVSNTARCAGNWTVQY